MKRVIASVTALVALTAFAPTPAHGAAPRDSASPVAARGTCSTVGCGGEVTNHSQHYIRISNAWCWSHDNDYYGDRLYPCYPWQNWDRSDLYPADMWLTQNQYSGNYVKYRDTDAFMASAGCTTVVNKWIGPVLLGRYVYDRHNTSSVWIKITDAHFIDVLSITC
ncbi:hypothetical protein [Amycolatopsis sp. NPDC098790]|uniref:hypothetical protein n=1 Tax=Amycolatopsis sp. NPDC098790 TaxID=3363939 RepID=UPI0037FD041B